MSSNFLVGHDFNFSPSPTMDAQSAQPQMQTLMGGAPGVTGSPFMQQLQKLGINGSKLQFNPMGKMQLLNQLEQSGSQNPAEIKNIISMFDDQMKNQNIDSQREYTDTLTRAQKSLEALYKG